MKNLKMSVKQKWYVDANEQIDKLFEEKVELQCKLNYKLYELDTLSDLRVHFLNTLSKDKGNELSPDCWTIDTNPDHPDTLLSPHGGTYDCGNLRDTVKKENRGKEAEVTQTKYDDFPFKAEEYRQNECLQLAKLHIKNLFDSNHEGYEKNIYLREEKLDSIKKNYANDILSGYVDEMWTKDMPI